ncbi:MAG: DinB family protein, partial [Chloroflexota bacterium]
SLEWLRKLDGANWETRYQHPPLEGLTAGDLLVSWAAHDLLHLRQVVELKWAYGQLQYPPYAAGYAGDW